VQTKESNACTYVILKNKIKLRNIIYDIEKKVNEKKKTNKI